MSYQAIISDKPVKVDISKRALSALKQRQAPLYIEMELYFSCLIRKALRFYEENTHPMSQAVAVTDNLFLSFRPVMTEVCKVEQGKGAPALTDFPIAKLSPYVPKWVQVDFHNGKWCGEFGYNF